MKDEAKTKKQLIEELNDLRRFIGEHFSDYRSSTELSDLDRWKEAARQMKNGQEKFMKSFLQNALPMGLTCQKEGRFVEVNDAFLKLSGFKRDEVIGATVTGLGLLTDEQRSSVLDKLNSKGRVENLELEVATKNNKYISGLINVVLMTLGRDKYRLMIVTDITKLKREEDERRNYEQKLYHLPIDKPMPWFIG